MTEIIVEIDSNSMILRINRPEKKNALNCSMYRSLTESFQQFEENSNLRALVIFGHEEIFTAGNDIVDFIERDRSDFSSPVISFLESLVTMKKPVLAGVRGPAVGIGTTMLLHCDLVYAGESASFQMPFVQLGLVPEAASSLILPQLVGHRRACELLFFGESFGPDVALESGLLNGIVPDTQLEDITMAAAYRVSQMPARSIRETKKLLSLHSDDVKMRIRQEIELFSNSLESDEAKEALNAFVEKRKPDFSRFN